MNSKSAFKKNIISNVALFALNLVIGFFLPKLLVSELGFSAYGMIPLANTIIGYAAIFTLAISGSLSRFLVMDLESGDKKEANTTFNTALASFAVLFLVLLPVMFFFSYQIGKLISIPKELENQTIFLFSAVSITFVAGAISSLFNSSAYVANRLDRINQINFWSTLIRIAFIFAFFYCIEISLYGYAWAVLIAGIFSLMYSVKLFKKFTPNITIDLKLFDQRKLKKLLSMGGWLTLIQGGAILFNQIDLLMVNSFFGSEEGGKYSVILQISLIIRVFATALAGSLGPLILKLFAAGDYSKIVEITKMSGRTLSLFIACIVGTLVLVGNSFLSLWIGSDFSSLEYLLIILIVHLPVNLGAMPLFSVNRAYNKVKWPGIFTIGTGMITVALSYCLIAYTDLGVYSIAISAGFILLFKNALFLPIYTAKSMGKDAFVFMGTPLASFVILAISFLLKYYLGANMVIGSWLLFICYSGALFALLLIVSFFLLKRNERRLIFHLLKIKL